MELYNGQLKKCDFNIRKKRKGRKKKTVKECLDIFTFDIEVTSYWIDSDGSIKNYVPGKSAEYWNEMKKGSLPYIWQFGFNDRVFYGRDIKDFPKLLKDLPEKTKIIVWVHNLSYEYGAALINLFKVDKVFARSPHSPIYAQFEEFPDIRFQCSYTLTNMSLATWGNELNVPKLSGDLDYREMRTPLTKLTEAELNYCERDCIVVYEGIKDHLKTYSDVFDIPLTSTGKVRRVVKAKLTADRDYMKQIKRLVPKDVKEYKRFQNIFAGGYTHCSRKYLGKKVEGHIEHVDLSSWYPTCMVAFKYPFNKWGYLGRVLPDPKTFEYRAYIIHLHLTDVRVKTWNTYISSSKCHGSGILTDNGRVLKASDLYIDCTELDYETIIATYEINGIIESLGTWVCQKKYLPTIFVKEILDLYKNKTELKGVDPVLYGISKQYVNSLYGMSVTNVIQTDVRYIGEGEWKIDELTDGMIEHKLNNMRRWFDHSYFLSYPAGCWITAYARHGLWQLIRSVDNELLYTDTDSLFYLGSKDWSWWDNMIDNKLKDACDYHGFDYEITRPKDKRGEEHPLGHLCREPDDIMFKSLGAKKYVEKREDGRLYMTVSGVNKAAVDCLGDDIDSFRDGFIFDKDAESMHKSEVTYINDMEPVTFPDGWYSDLKYGINMRPTGYKLSIPRIYDKLDVLIDNYLNPNETSILRKRGYVL